MLLFRWSGTKYAENRKDVTEDSTQTNKKICPFFPFPLLSRSLTMPFQQKTRFQVDKIQAGAALSKEDHLLRKVAHYHNSPGMFLKKVNLSAKGSWELCSWNDGFVKEKK